jgi:hypothetical protein
MNNKDEVGDPFDCDQLDKPAETEACTQRACGYWRTGDWGEVSVFFFVFVHINRAVTINNNWHKF